MSREDYTQGIQRVLTYIDAQIGEPMTPDGLASLAGFSTYHFCRVFAWITGHAPMEYVRGRRLAFAAAALGTGARILDVAVLYGFETHSGFSKAFRRQYGCPPEVYRIHASAERPRTPSIETMWSYSIGGIVMEPKFVALPEVHLAGYVLRTRDVDGENSKSIPAFWAAYLADGRMERLHAQPFVSNHTEYGACFQPDPETGEFDYVIGVKVEAGDEIPPEFHRCTLPAATYAVFSSPPSDGEHFSQNIQGTWAFIFNEWFPESGYEYAPGCVDFELYDERCQSDKDAVCDIYIPVVKKG